MSDSDRILAKRKRVIALANTARGAALLAPEPIRDALHALCDAVDELIEMRDLEARKAD